jgi:hypothetical protein
MDMPNEGGGHDVLQCFEADADYFGVYIGGPGDLMWAADFNNYTDALNWAIEVAENYDYELCDIVALEKEISCTPQSNN